jgi:hypothetical protein
MSHQHDNRHPHIPCPPHKTDAWWAPSPPIVTPTFQATPRTEYMVGGAYLLLMISQLAALRVRAAGRLPGHVRVATIGWPSPCGREYAKRHQWLVPGSSEFWRIFQRIESGLQP